MLLASAEALLVVLVGIGVPLTLGTVVWGVDYGFAAGWDVVWRFAADAWLLGHGVDVAFQLAPEAAAATGLPGADQPFEVGIAILGFAVVTAALALRAGRRIRESEHLVVGAVAAIVVFAAAATAIVLLAGDPAADPSVPQGIILPTAVFAAGLAVGALTGTVSRPRPAPRAPVLVAADAALRGGAAAAAAVIAVAAAVAVFAAVASFTSIITLYESLHADVVGGLVLTLAQMLALPNLVAWTAAWLVGPGFSIGTGSIVSPFQTVLGPLPPLPLLGAVPASSGEYAWLAVLAPIAAGILVGVLVQRRVRARLGDWATVGAAVAAGVLGGVFLGLLAAVSAGAAGPGRLADVGPDGVQVGVWAALELVVGAVLGVLVAQQADAYERRRSSRR